MRLCSQSAQPMAVSASETIGGQAGNPQAEIGGVGLLLGEDGKRLLARARLFSRRDGLLPRADGLFVWAPPV